MEDFMLLKDLLEKMITENMPFSLIRNEQETDAGSLLESLSVPMLKKRVHLVPGLYIAEISDAGYLGGVLFKLKQK